MIVIKATKHVEVKSHAYKVLFNLVLFKQCVVSVQNIFLAKRCKSKSSIYCVVTYATAYGRKHVKQRCLEY